MDSICDLTASIEAELSNTEQYISEAIKTGDSFGINLEDCFVRSSGKRLRPALCLLTFKSLTSSDSSVAVKMAASIELLHTASLVHDDLIDESTSRRGKKTVHSSSGRASAVLYGDVLFAESFKLAALTRNPALLDVLIQVSGCMSGTELKSYSTRFDYDSVTVETYLSSAGGKTATLIGACSHTAAILASGRKKIAHLCRDAAVSAGMAFQMTDDLLDFLGDSSVTGKESFCDLRSGVYTWPVIKLVEICKDGRFGGSEEILEILSEASIEKTLGARQIRKIVAAIDYLGLLEQMKIVRDGYLVQALEISSGVIPDSGYKEALQALFRFMAHRKW